MHLNAGDIITIKYHYPRRFFTRHYFGVHKDNLTKFHVRRISSMENRNWVTFEIKNITLNLIFLTENQEVIRIFTSRKAIKADGYHRDITDPELPFIRSKMKIIDSFKSYHHCINEDVI